MTWRLGWNHHQPVYWRASSSNHLGTATWCTWCWVAPFRLPVCNSSSRRWSACTLKLLTQRGIAGLDLPPSMHTKALHTWNSRTSCRPPISPMGSRTSRNCGCSSFPCGWSLFSSTGCSFAVPLFLLPPSPLRWWWSPSTGFGRSWSYMMWSCLLEWAHCGYHHWRCTRSWKTQNLGALSEAPGRWAVVSDHVRDDFY